MLVNSLSPSNVLLRAYEQRRLYCTCSPEPSLLADAINNKLEYFLTDLDDATGIDSMMDRTNQVFCNNCLLAII